LTSTNQHTILPARCVKRLFKINIAYIQVLAAVLAPFDEMMCDKKSIQSATLTSEAKLLRGTQLMLFNAGFSPTL
jgi:hypothetical protein